MTTITMISTVIAAISVAFAVLTYRKNLQHKRMEFLVKLYFEYLKDADVQKAFYLIDYSKFNMTEYNADKTIEIQVDRLFAYMDLFAKVKFSDLMTDAEIKTIDYELKRIKANQEVEKYFKRLDMLTQTTGASQKFHSLREYLAKMP